MHSGVEALRIHSLESQGHRGDVRSLAISSDNSMVLSCSYNGIKIWNALSGNCLRTCQGGYGLCCCFVVGDKYAVVGTKNGESPRPNPQPCVPPSLPGSHDHPLTTKVSLLLTLSLSLSLSLSFGLSVAGTVEVYDISFGGRIQVIEDAHGQAVWSLRALPDSTGLVTVSGDGQIKFWEYAMSTQSAENGSAENGGAQASKTLALEERRALKMPDDVLCVAIDPAGKHVAVGMIDSTVKIFFLDSLKFYLSLYGHKLPVLCCDISSDGTLIASGSADKNLKIWGMDFGDCHKR